MRIGGYIKPPSIVGRWLKPLKNDAAYSKPPPTSLHRTPLPDPPAILHRGVRIGAQIDAACKLDPRRRLEERFFAREETANEPRPIVRRLLRKAERDGLDEAALCKDLRNDRCRAQRSHDSHEKHEPKCFSSKACEWPAA